LYGKKRAVDRYLRLGRKALSIVQGLLVVDSRMSDYSDDDDGLRDVDKIWSNLECGLVFKMRSERDDTPDSDRAMWASKASFNEIEASCMLCWKSDEVKREVVASYDEHVDALRVFPEIDKMIRSADTFLPPREGWGTIGGSVKYRNYWRGCIDENTQKMNVEIRKFYDPMPGVVHAQPYSNVQRANYCINLMRGPYELHGMHLKETWKQVAWVLCLGRHRRLDRNGKPSILYLTTDRITITRIADFVVK